MNLLIIGNRLVILYRHRWGLWNLTIICFSRLVECPKQFSRQRIGKKEMPLHSSPLSLEMLTMHEIVCKHCWQPSAQFEMLLFNLLNSGCHLNFSYDRKSGSRAGRYKQTCNRSGGTWQESWVGIVWPEECIAPSVIFLPLLYISQALSEHEQLDF